MDLNTKATWQSQYMHKKVRQNQTWFHENSPRESRARENIPQHNKEYIRQTQSQHYSK